MYDLIPAAVAIRGPTQGLKLQPKVCRSLSERMPG
jgi:hypothetical protein